MVISVRRTASVYQTQRLQHAHSQNHQALAITEKHLARGQASQNGVSDYDSHENGQSMKRISSFMSSNMRAIRRLSRLPSSGMSLENLMDTYRPPIPHPHHQRGVPTPPISRTSRLSSSSGHLDGSLNFRGRASSIVDASIQPTRHHNTASPSSFPYTRRPISPPRSRSPSLKSSAAVPIPPIPASEALPSLLAKMSRRQMPGAPPSPTSLPDYRKSARSNMGSTGIAESANSRARSTTRSLRTLVLNERRLAPTF